MPITPWKHDNPFVPGTTVRADSANFKFNGIAANFEAIAARLNNKTIELPGTFIGQVKIPEKSVANTLLFINSAGNMDVFSKTQFDLDVSNTATLASQVATNAGQVATNTSQVASNTSQVASNTNQVATNTATVVSAREYVESVMPQVVAASEAAVTVESARAEVANNTTLVQTLADQTQDNASGASNSANSAYNYMLLAQQAAGSATGGMYFAGTFNGLAYPPTPEPEDGTPLFMSTADNPTLKIIAEDFVFYDHIGAVWRNIPGKKRAEETELFALAGL